MIFKWKVPLPKEGINESPLPRYMYWLVPKVLYWISDIITIENRTCIRILTNFQVKSAPLCDFIKNNITFIKDLGRFLGKLCPCCLLHDCISKPCSMNWLVLSLLLRNWPDYPWPPLLVMSVRILANFQVQMPRNLYTTVVKKSHIDLVLYQC